MKGEIDEQRELEVQLHSFLTVAIWMDGVMNPYGLCALSQGIKYKSWDVTLQLYWFQLW